MAAFREIALTQGYIAKVDAEDYVRLSAIPWYPAKIGRYVYARTMWRIPGSGDPGMYVATLMQNILLLIPRGFRGDHINGDTLDYRKQNLRVVTHAQNLWNMGPRPDRRFKGASFHKEKGSWRARIMINRVTHWLGYFESEEDAARAYDAAAKIYQGEYARLNFPEES